ncbi:MAG TPA: hypothetical protein PKE12_15840 [Kiritimatiellia bacterium]|nr:hypothetical protein [Kiritimatiellia bacterium]
MKARLIRMALMVLALVVAHEFMLRWCADRNVVSVIFAGGAHVEWRLLAAAALFIALRLLVVLFLAGSLLARLVDLCWRRRMG